MASTNFNNPYGIVQGTPTPSATYPPNTFSVYKTGSICTLQMSFAQSATYTLPQAQVVVGTLPTGFKPITPFTFPIQSEYASLYVQVTSDGNVNVYNYRTSKPTVNFTVSFPIGS